MSNIVNINTNKDERKTINCLKSECDDKKEYNDYNDKGENSGGERDCGGMGNSTPYPLTPSYS